MMDQPMMAGVTLLDAKMGYKKFKRWERYGRETICYTALNINNFQTQPSLTQEIFLR
jgi:hypothetical protein